MTAISDFRLSSMRRIVPAGLEVPDFEPRRRSFDVQAGDELMVGVKRAETLERDGLAVPVDTSKMGKAQRRLLVRLLELTELQQKEADAHNTWTQLRGWLRSDDPSKVAEGEGAAAGDDVQRIDSQRITWNLKRVAEGLSDPVSASSLSHALMPLERRGLVLRDVPWGERGPARGVTLTTPGRVEAKKLRG